MVILLTSFDTWLPHQISNSSDDLLKKIEQEHHDNLCLLRKLPVDTNLASQKVINKIQEVNPQSIICCGMAEKRNHLTIESNARSKHNCHKSPVNLTQLLSCLNHTSISHDAGKFVCEGLYYQVLEFLKIKKVRSNCIFVHIPIINPSNTQNIYDDFLKIIKFLENKPDIIF